MKQKSWHINRREFIKGGGAALDFHYSMACRGAKQQQGRHYQNAWS